MSEDWSKRQKKLAKNKKLAHIYYHEKKHKEQREKMQTAKGGYTDDISCDDELETLKPGWKERTESLRSSLRKRKSRAKSLWRGR